MELSRECNCSENKHTKVQAECDCSRGFNSKPCVDAFGTRCTVRHPPTRALCPGRNTQGHVHVRTCLVQWGWRALSSHRPGSDPSALPGFHSHFLPPEGVDEIID